MNKSSMSILLAAMMATSGFAVAQTTPAPVPAQGGSTMVTPSPSDGSGPKTRAAVKSEINTSSGAKVGAPAQGGGAPSGASTMSTPTGANARADVKAQVGTQSKSGSLAQGGSTVSGAPDANASSTSSTAAERRAKRADRKAMRKAKRDASASSSTNMNTGKGADAGPGTPARTAPQ